jgi:hypothetical protein
MSKARLEPKEDLSLSSSYPLLSLRLTRNPTAIINISFSRFTETTGINFT